MESRKVVLINLRGKNRNADAENRLWTLQGKERVGQIERVALAYIHSVQFSCSVMSNSLGPHRIQHARLSCPSPTPGAC